MLSLLVIGDKFNFREECAFSDAVSLSLLLSHLSWRVITKWSETGCVKISNSEADFSLQFACTSLEVFLIWNWLCVIIGRAAICFMLIQKPFSGRTLTKRQVSVHVCSLLFSVMSQEIYKKILMIFCELSSKIAMYDVLSEICTVYCTWFVGLCSLPQLDANPNPDMNPNSYPYLSQIAQCIL